jgi:hypothetical protein
MKRPAHLRDSAQVLRFRIGIDGTCVVKGETRS